MTRLDRIEEITKDKLVDLSKFKFNRDEANDYDETLDEALRLGEKSGFERDFDAKDHLKKLNEDTPSEI